MALTLLEKAMAIGQPAAGRKIVTTDEELELVIAYLSDKVNATQADRAAGENRGNWLFQIPGHLRRAIADGRVSIVRRKP